MQKILKKQYRCVQKLNLKLITMLFVELVFLGIYKLILFFVISYIAHTDEFCLTTVGTLNCYVFSPVCNFRLGIASGIARKVVQSRSIKINKNQKNKSYLNKN